jgi:hypothetical protein
MRAQGQQVENLKTCCLSDWLNLNFRINHPIKKAIQVLECVDKTEQNIGSAARVKIWVTVAQKESNGQGRKTGSGRN